MEDLEFAMFSWGEMERRYGRAREEMERCGMDGLLVTGEENFQYFAGTSASVAGHASLTRPSVFVLPLEGEPVVVTQGRDNLELGSYVTDVRGYSELFTFPLGVVMEVLRDVGVVSGRVGVELGLEQRMGMPVGAYEEMKAALPEVDFVDGAEVFWKLRKLKSEEELRYIREAAGVTGRARQRLFEELRPGMTEREVVRRMRGLMLEEGGDGTSFVMLLLGLPGSRNVYSYDRPLESGQVVGVDTGACVGMYTVDYTRWAVLGRASDAVKRVHEGVREVDRAMVEALGPGVRCSEVYGVGMAAMGAVCAKHPELERFGPARMGHGQGMLITEPPSVNPEDHTVLEPGMVLSTEPGLGCGAVRMLWEDVHVITEDGSEKLTMECEELWEIV